MNRTCQIVLYMSLQGKKELLGILSLTQAIFHITGCYIGIPGALNVV
jgi:hypothetical protein